MKADAAEAAATLLRDRQHAYETWQAFDTDPDGYNGPETIMLSTGYADVCLDGDVVQHGVVIFNVSEGP